MRRMEPEVAMALEVHNPLALLLLVLVPVIIWVSRISLAGLSRGRRIFSTALRCLILVALVLALADLHSIRTGDELTVIFALDQSKSIPDPWRLRETRR